MFKLLIFSLLLQKVYSDTINIPLQSGINVLDPIKSVDTNTQFVINNSFEGLVKWSSKDGYGGVIAKNWKIDVKKKIIEFDIASDKIFSDGEKLKCNHVQAVFKRILSPENTMKTAYSRIRKTYCKGNSFILELKAFDPSIFGLLSSANSKIYKMANGKFISTANYQPQIKSAKNILLVSIDKTRPNINLEVMDDDEAYKRAINGKIDAILLSNVQKNSKELNGKTLKNEMWAVWGIGLKSSIDVGTRKMLSLKLTSKDFVSQVFPKEKEADSLTPYLLPIGTNIKADGVVSKSKVSTVELSLPKEIPNADQIIAWLKKSSGNTGNLKIKLTAFDKMIELYSQNKLDAYLLSMNSELPDPYSMLRLLHSSSMTNPFGINDYKIDSMIEKLDDENLSDEKKALLVLEINRYVINNGLFIPLAQMSHHVWLSSCIEGVELSPISEAYFDITKVVKRCKKD